MALNQLIRWSQRLLLRQQKRDDDRAPVEKPTVKYQSVNPISELDEGLCPHPRYEDHEALRRRPTISDQANLVDLADCANLGERLHLIAMAAGGWLEIAPALDTIMKSGVTKGSKRTLRSEIHRWFRHHASDWERIANGLYRYRRAEERDLEDL